MTALIKIRSESSLQWDYMRDVPILLYSEHMSTQLLYGIYILRITNGVHRTYNRTRNNNVYAMYIRQNFFDEIIK